MHRITLDTNGCSLFGVGWVLWLPYNQTDVISCQHQDINPCSQCKFHVPALHRWCQWNQSVHCVSDSQNRKEIGWRMPSDRISRSGFSILTRSTESLNYCTWSLETGCSLFSQIAALDQCIASYRKYFVHQPVSFIMNDSFLSTWSPNLKKGKSEQEMHSCYLFFMYKSTEERTYWTFETAFQLSKEGPLLWAHFIYKRKGLCLHTIQVLVWRICFSLLPKMEIYSSFMWTKWPEPAMKSDRSLRRNFLEAAGSLASAAECRSSQRKQHCRLKLTKCLPSNFEAHKLTLVFRFAFRPQKSNGKKWTAILLVFLWINKRRFSQIARLVHHSITLTNILTKKVHIQNSWPLTKEKQIHEADMS